MRNAGVKYPIRSEDQSRPGWRSAERTAQRSIARIGSSVSTGLRSAGLLAAGPGGIVAAGSIGGGAAAGATALATIGFTIVGGAEFERSISSLAAITGAAGDDLALLRGEADRLGAATTLSANQVAQGFQLVGSVRPELLRSIPALTGVTEEVILLAEAAGTQLPQAADIAVTALNNFELASDQAGRVVNVLAAAQRAGSASVEEVGAALRDAAPGAQLAGIAFEETVAAIELLAERGFRGARAGTALRAIFTRLQTRMDADVNPAVVGLSAALEELARRQLDVTELTESFGEEAQAAAAALIAQADKFDDFVGQLDDTSAAAEQASTRTNNLAGDWSRLGSQASALGNTIFDGLNPALRGAVKFFTDLTEAANTAAQAVTDGDAEFSRSVFQDVQRTLDRNASVGSNIGTLSLQDVQGRFSGARDPEDSPFGDLFRAARGEPTSEEMAAEERAERRRRAQEAEQQRQNEEAVQNLLRTIQPVSRSADQLFSDAFDNARASLEDLTLGLEKPAETIARIRDEQIATLQQAVESGFLSEADSAEYFRRIQEQADAAFADIAEDAESKIGEAFGRLADRWRRTNADFRDIALDTFFLIAQTIVGNNTTGGGGFFSQFARGLLGIAPSAAGGLFGGGVPAGAAGLGGGGGSIVPGAGPFESGPFGSPLTGFGKASVVNYIDARGSSDPGGIAQAGDTVARATASALSNSEKRGGR